MDEQKLNEELKKIQKLGQENKNVDVAALMMNALKRDEANATSSRQKHWAYFISIAFPPFGLIFAIKFYFSDKSDGRRLALTCVILTVLAFFVVWLFAKILLSGSGVSLEQIQQVDRQELRDLLEY